MSDTDAAVPRMDMTRVASAFATPPPALGGEHPAAVVAMNERLWALVDVTLFRAKVALSHHGYDDVVGEINGAIAEVAEAWGEVLEPGGDLDTDTDTDGRVASCGVTPMGPGA